MQRIKKKSIKTFLLLLIMQRYWKFPEEMSFFIDDQIYSGKRCKIDSIYTMYT